MPILTTDRNLVAIGEGIDETGRAGEALVAGNIVYLDGTDDRWKKPEAGPTSAAKMGVVLNQHPPKTDFEEDDMIRVRVKGLAVVVASGEVAEHEHVAPDADGKVQDWKAVADDPVEPGNLELIKGRAQTSAAADGDKLVIEVL